MIRRILWDLGGVVILSDHVITFARLVQLGLPARLARKFFATPVYADFSRGRITEHWFYQHQISMNLGRPIGYDDMVAAHDAHMWAIDEDVVALMRRVTAPLAFATDTNMWQTRRERELIDVRQFSDTVFRSDEIGSLKADPGCFARIVSALGEDPTTVLLIDDSWEKVAQADALGLQTIRYDANAEQLEAELMSYGCLR